jgi:hypothetical protein
MNELNTSFDVAQPATTSGGYPKYGSANLHRQKGRFKPHNSKAPILGGIDIAGVSGMAVITLGPLATYAYGAGF